MNPKTTKCLIGKFVLRIMTITFWILLYFLYISHLLHISTLRFLNNSIIGFYYFTSCGFLNFWILVFSLLSFLLRLWKVDLNHWSRKNGPEKVSNVMDVMESGNYPPPLHIDIFWNSFFNWCLPFHVYITISYTLNSFKLLCSVTKKN